MIAQIFNKCDDGLFGVWFDDVCIFSGADQPDFTHEQINT